MAASSLYAGMMMETAVIGHVSFRLVWAAEVVRLSGVGEVTLRLRSQLRCCEIILIYFNSVLARSCKCGSYTGEEKQEGCRV